MKDFTLIDVSGDDDGLDDIYQLLCPLSSPLDSPDTNNNCLGSSTTDGISHNQLSSSSGQTKAKHKELRNHPSSSSSRRGRPRVCPLTDKIIRERRDAANARERKRMNQMTRAYTRLKEKLPNNDNIHSKKQIVDQVQILRDQTLNRKCQSFF